MSYEESCLRDDIRRLERELAVARYTMDELRSAAKPFLAWLDEHYPTNDGCSGATSTQLGDPSKKMRAAFRAAFTEKP